MGYGLGRAGSIELVYIQQWLRECRIIFLTIRICVVAMCAKGSAASRGAVDAYGFSSSSFRGSYRPLFRVLRLVLPQLIMFPGVVRALEVFFVRR